MTSATIETPLELPVLTSAIEDMQTDPIDIDMKRYLLQG